jgi:hypothetical protein
LLNAPTGLTPIYPPPAAITVIQSDGYKVWIDNPEYAAGKELADARSAEIASVKLKRFKSMESILLDYLKFILKCDAFRTMSPAPFRSEDDVRSVLAERCGGHWYETYDQDFDEWLDQFFSDLDLSCVIADDTRQDEAESQEYATFQEAMSTARYVSMTEGVQVIVERVGLRWTVARPTAPAAAHDGILCDHGDHSDFDVADPNDDSDDDSDENPTYDDWDRYGDEVRQEIIEEAYEFADGLARSDSDGWFYPD